MPTSPELHGQRVLITRPHNQTSPLRDALEAIGLEVVSIPVIEIVPPSSWSALDRALEPEEFYDWLVLTSANAADSLAARLQLLGRPTSFSRLAVVGAATAHRAQTLGLNSTELLLPERALAESLAEALIPRIRDLLRTQPRVRALLPRAEHAPDLLPQALRAAGAAVVVAPAYQNRIPESAVQALRQLFAERHRWPAAIPFTSSSSVTGLLQALHSANLALPVEVQCVSIGEVTSRTLQQAGLHLSAEASVATVAGLVAAVREALLRAPKL